MITAKKFANLPTSTQIRKLIRLLTAAELSLRGEQPQQWSSGDWPLFLTHIIPLESLRSWTHELKHLSQNPWSLRDLNNLRHTLQAHLHQESADWDMLPPLIKEDSSIIDGPRPLPGKGELTGPQVCIYLDGVRSPFNVGSIFRTAWAYDCKQILLSPEVPKPDHHRVIRSSMGATNHIPWEVVEQSALLNWCKKRNFEPLALETGGTLLGNHPLPTRWLIILGSEELGVSPELLEQVKRVSIPLPGGKRSLNVGVSLGIGLAHWNQPKEFIR